MIVRILVDLVQAFIVVLFVRILLTWFPTNPWSPVGRFERALGRVTDPILAPFRRLVPPLRVGGGAIDVSPIVLFVVLVVLVGLLRSH
ncbi:MAG TPA: YggT family protein [Acidimicrobiales bacterium]|nr:YggT family protein [Acidimicrobiales bacterium]